MVRYMKSFRPLIFKMPVSVIFLTILANLIGFLSSGFFQTVNVLLTGALEKESIGVIVAYSAGAGFFISLYAIPISLVLVGCAALISSRFTRWHLGVTLMLGLFIGISGMGNFYIAVPILAYTVTTAVASCMLILWRQRNLTMR